MKKHIALTFDDGPNTNTTVDILDIIEQYGIPATFFVIGNNINEQSVKSMERAVKLGCDIENHSYTHPAMPELTAEEIIDEINRTDDKILETAGRKPQFFRPPYIAHNQLMHDLIPKTFISGINAVDWDNSISAEMRYEKIMAQVEDGVIILLHDMEENVLTVDALKMIIPALLLQGYEFVTVSELFRIKNIQPWKNVVYNSVFQ